MLTITIQVNAPAGKAIGIKEDLAMYLERFGDAKVLEIKEDRPDPVVGAQTSLFGESRRK